MAPSGEHAFVIADLAGYTALTEAHGGAEAAKTVARYTELASKALTPGVRLAERVGDQVLIVSEDACSAVMTSLRLKDAVDREPLFLGVRIGVDVGVPHACGTGDCARAPAIQWHDLLLLLISVR